MHLKGSKPLTWNASNTFVCKRLECFRTVTKCTDTCWIEDVLLYSQTIDVQLGLKRHCRNFTYCSDSRRVCICIFALCLQRSVSLFKKFSGCCRLLLMFYLSCNCLKRPEQEVSSHQILEHVRNTNAEKMPHGSETHLPYSRKSMSSSLRTVFWCTGPVLHRQDFIMSFSHS